MINFFQAQRLSLKKIRFNKGKSLFVIVPISLMFGIIVIAASEAKNLIQVAHNSIFSPIQSQNEVVEVNKSSAMNLRQALSETSTDGYTSTDNGIVSAISNVEKVSLISELPLENVKTDNIFADKTVYITSLAGLDNEYAQLYTTSNFTYTEGQPIPIILNANDFAEVYEDWQGKTEISVDFTKATDPSQTSALESQSPVKTKAISYNRADLLGKTITISFGGLDAISDISQESTTTGYKYTQKTAEAIAKEVATRKTALEKYWNYDKISTPLTYTFVIAGISEGTDKTKAYIPSAFATKLLQDYLQNEISARNTTAIPLADQNATYTGLVYDGVNLQTDTTSTIFAGIRNQVTSQVGTQIDSVNSQIDQQNQQIATINNQNQAIYSQIKKNVSSSTGGEGGRGPGGMTPPNIPRFKSVTSSISKLSTSTIKISYSGAAASYSIPGLVYSKNRTTSEVAGEYVSFDFTKAISLPSKSILIKINSIANRDQVVTDLNAKGYSYQDYSQYKQYDKLESYLYLILNIASIIFMAVTALFILINMAKFVSEGRKEIGIFRAIGATKSDIGLIFILQSLSYILLSLIFGAALGVGAVLGLSQLMVGQAQSFINTAVGSTVILNSGITQANFLNFDYQMVLIYAGCLILITLIVSLIPSSQAARVSPVEAIRNS
jgi:ABC-type antimicrobial peptide transport system permease subunit